jgi:hypothetical protein
MIRTSIKRGDTFLYSATVTEDDGDLVNLAGWVISSQLRSVSGSLIDTLEVEYTNAAAGQYTLSADTALWPVGDAKFDIQYTSPDGVISSTDDILVKIKPDQTA